MYIVAEQEGFPIPDNCTGGQVSRWESRDREPDPLNKVLLCIALDAPSDELGLLGNRIDPNRAPRRKAAPDVNPATVSTGEDKTKRRDFLGLGMAMVGNLADGSSGWLAGPDVIDRLAWLLSNTRQVHSNSKRCLDASDVEAVRETVAAFSTPRPRCRKRISPVTKNWTLSGR